MGNICDLFSFNKECNITNNEINNKKIIQILFRF